MRRDGRLLAFRLSWKGTFVDASEDIRLIGCRPSAGQIVFLWFGKLLAPPPSKVPRTVRPRFNEAVPATLA